MDTKPNAALRVAATAILAASAFAAPAAAQPSLVDAVHGRFVYSFKGGQDGATPRAGLYADKHGALYGTTSQGPTTCTGSNNMIGCGTVFKLTPAGTGYAMHTIYRFAGGSDGANPFAGLIGDGSGALYGTTAYGGSGNFGTVFKLTPSPGGYVETVLYRFKGMPDGEYPVAGLVADNTGALYGTTSAGGTGTDSTCGGSQFIFGCGTVFKLTPSGSGYTESILYNFLGLSHNDGEYPVAGVLLDPAGAVYGTTEFGGPNFAGTVFKLSPSGSGYTESVLYHFCAKPSCTDGSSPYATLIADASGALYSTTNLGGDAACNGGGHGGCGTVFKLTPSPSGYAESVLYAFKGGTDGEQPQAGLLPGSGGALYSTTSIGGPRNGGIVFKITPTPNGYVRHLLHAFGLGARGAAVPGSLIANKSGDLLGTTVYGDRKQFCSLLGGGCGTVFELMP
jgi:uncharacterized repeat protein (TIGR03803 family)